MYNQGTPEVRVAPRGPQMKNYGDATISMVELEVHDKEIPQHLQPHFRQYLPITDAQRGPSQAYKARSRVGVNANVATAKARRALPPSPLKTSKQQLA